MVIQLPVPEKPPEGHLPEMEMEMLMQTEEFRPTVHRPVLELPPEKAIQTAEFLPERVRRRSAVTQMVDSPSETVKVKILVAATVVVVFLAVI